MTDILSIPRNGEPPLDGRTKCFSRPWYLFFEGLLGRVAPASASSAAPVLNAASRISDSRDALVSYTVATRLETLVLGSASALLLLQYADDAAMTSNLVTVADSPVSLAGAVNLDSVTPVVLSGVIPAGKYRRITTQVVSGTATFDPRTSQEVLL